MLSSRFISDKIKEIDAAFCVLKIIGRIIVHPFFHPEDPPLDLQVEKRKIRIIIYSDFLHNPLVTMKLTLAAVNLLKYVVSADGKKEVNPEGKEVDSPRRLNGEESAQRRFFMKEADRIQAEMKPEIEAVVSEYNEFLYKKRVSLKEANPKSEGESDEDYNKRISSLLEKDAELQEKFAAVQSKNVELGLKQHVLDLTSKSVDFLKKYFVEFGNEVGYLQGDDAAVEELNGAFGV